MGLNTSAVQVPGVGHFYVAPIASVTNKALTSNVATLTTSSAHGFAVSDSITVSGVDATFNGTFTITAVTSTTLSYAKTAANVTSTAATGTIKGAKPTGTSAPSAPWVEIGYTSYEKPLTITRDGGDSKVLPAWQAPSGLRTSTSAVSYKLGFELLQYDELSLQLYYGGGSVNATTDEFEAPKSGTPQNKSLFVRIIDGDDTGTRYYPSTDIIGSDDEELDAEALAALPVTATVLEDDDLSYLFTLAGPATVA